MKVFSLLLFNQPFGYKKTLQKAKRTTITLMKILIPVVILIKILKYFEVLNILGSWISPLMSIVGLSGNMGLVFITGLTGIWGAIAIFYSLLPTNPISIAETTTLMSMIIIAHSFIPEQFIINKLGLKIIPATLIRSLAAFSYGFLLNQFYSYFNLLQSPLKLGKFFKEENLSWTQWAIDSLELLLIISIVIYGLVFLLRFFEVTFINTLLVRLLSKILRPFGIASSMTTITSIGLLLGVAYGGGLMIENIKESKPKPKEIFLAAIFLSICHSLIEDTLLMASVGADFSGILIGRLLFTFIVMYLMKIIISKINNNLFNRLFFNVKNHDNLSTTSPNLMINR